MHVTWNSMEWNTGSQNQYSETNFCLSETNFCLLDNEKCDVTCGKWNTFPVYYVRLVSIPFSVSKKFYLWWDCKWLVLVVDCALSQQDLYKITQRFERIQKRNKYTKSLYWIYYFSLVLLLLLLLFSLALQPSAGYGLLVTRGFLITHNDAPQSVELLLTVEQLVAETSTWQHTTHTTNKHPRLQWGSNPRPL
jgi:hypothetical protein